MESHGRQLHAKAEQAREEGKFQESLDLNNEALRAYDAVDDSLGFSEGIASRSITLRVYANAHDSNRLLILAKYEMLGAVEIARDSGNKGALALPLYHLAQIYEDLGELSEAITSYKEAIKQMQDTPPDRHNRSEVIANMKVHMMTCEYKAGDKTALERAEIALRDLESAQNPNTYEQDVWVSGGYMRIASVLKEDKPQRANEYLQTAKEIIESNSQLKLRKEQWNKLAATFRQ